MSTSIWIYDRNEQLQIVLSPGSKSPFRNGWYVEQLNGRVTLSFEVPNDIEGAELIQGDGRAVIRDQDGHLVEFIIRQPEDRDGWKYVFAEGSDYENIDEWITGYTQSNVTLKTAASAILQNTRWDLGECGDFGTNSVDFEDITVKNAVHQLTELFNAERRYRVEAEGNRITKRYIDFLPRRGQVTGKRFEEGKDISKYSRLVNTDGIKTALYGRGASGENDRPRLDFGNVEWVKANGDPVDKPLGQTWVGDPEALQQWGYDQGTRHRWGSYDGQEEDPGELLLNTWKHLQMISDAVYTYNFDVILLQDLTGYDHEKVRLGDTVSGIVRRVRPPIEVEASIIEYRQNLNDNKKSKVMLGEFRRYFDYSGRMKTLEKTVNSRRGNWMKKETPEGAQQKADNAESNSKTFTQTYAEKVITKSSTAPSSPEIGDLWIDTSVVPSVWKRYNGTSWEKLTRTLMNEIGGQITTTQIQDDAISTPKLKANVVTANELASNSVTTDHISTVGLDAGVITVGTLSGIVINVETDITVGQYASFEPSTNDEKGVIFQQDVAGAYRSKIVSELGLNNIVVYGYDGIRLESPIDKSIFIGNPGAYSIPITLGGIVEIGGSLTNPNSIIDTDVEFRSSISETGFVGVGGVGNGTLTTAVALTGVNFRQKKNYTPSSVSLTAQTSNRTGFVTDITAEGFSLYVEGGGSSGFCYWRGNYTA